MFLKRLDIIGFKSFAERIGVDFVQGVTAVVGPNGSGKSNITDAIRWVLGEQSAKSLRGSKMEDIIFAGSDSRKPLNYAEVTLTLDNQDEGLAIDYNEVSVTRRVTRAGDSEYLINKQPCRLKDIVDLFMDSGLGREAFSIISQGKVEEILNSKAEDRRTIFEEAAGVLKYKNRKKKAEAKLVETQENLNRVNDILHELEGQVEPLKIQASMAKDYLEKKEELEKIEVALTVYDIEELHQKWTDLSTQLEEHQQEEIKLSAQLQIKEAKIEETRDHIAALDESITDLQNVLLHASEELEKLEGRKDVLKERKKNAVQNRAQLEKSIAELTDKISQLKRNKEIQADLVDKLTEQVNYLQTQLQEKQGKMALFTENIEEKIETLKSEYIELLNDQAGAKNELKYIVQQLEQQETRSSRLDSENVKFLEERQKAQNKMLQVQTALEEVQKGLSDQVTSFREKQRKLENVQNNYQKQEKTLYQAYQILQQAKSRKEMLEEMEEDYSGFFQGVKEVLKARGKKLHGIEGAVAELVTVPKEYETALETALGGALQHIVVDTEQNARMAIQFLKQNSFGRATFLPLSVIKGRMLSSSQLTSIQTHPSLVGSAVDLVSFDPKYSEVISNLLGNVVITKDLKGANELAKILQYRCRMVTLDGDIVNPGGSMTGGAQKQKTSSLLTRKGELEELKEKLNIMSEKTSSLESHVKALKEDVKTHQFELEAMRRFGEELRQQEQALKGDLREAEFETKNINDRLRIYDLEKGHLIEEQKTITNRKAELNEAITIFKEKIASLDAQIAKLTEQKTNDISSRETLTKEITDLKVEFAAKNEQFVNAKERLVMIVEELNESQERFTLYKEDLMLLTSEMEGSTSGEVQLEAAAKRKQQDKEETISLISSRRQERLQMQAALEDAEIEVKEIKRLHKGMVEVLKDEEVKINRLDVELETKLAHLREEYLLSFDGAKEQYPLALPVEEARKKVKLIKLAIEELGSVNIGAIEEYERVSERYEFLNEQKNDLQEAKDTLYQVIDEMDTEMKKRFEQTFYGIREQFEPVFRALFGGGRADLKLTHPEDLLNTGVEIVAQPPGKKLQNLGLLSGGERALTAIALLFSILKVRPVPFCILDEVEAALDEANVFRFSQYLKRFSSETQFIVITHRKGTMEEADVLYGVTMQESGVSKLVSVRLEDTKELVKT
ncbi:chromosome segregation protein SMC [Neobacillus sp. 179-C4.2 HS]|uniref:Chromosome partition protein Smc n=1 Tax=Neobacillus driksii TaxID=3035913 RepID=A0ABV4YWM8_9BACI|nr:chromosome segregation protein SMC [Neobacillus sp. 179.-C4.2 HS]MDP5192474.1 chromosome segregation protein SMC [Neobacillus sp. 179.-C4.2 HS]